MANSEYLTLIEILPPFTQSLAPVTTQYPGSSSGPLTISFVSTKFDILGALDGNGGPPGKIAELIKSSFNGFSGGGFNPALNLVLISIEKTPDFLDKAEGPSHSDLRILAEDTVEKPSRRNRTFFILTTFTSNQAFVTIEAVSSMGAPLYSTGAVQTCENMLQITGSK
ncbi:hypothetical protein OIU85_022845 [Salix viminalis]|uniref:Uncharacterized protein n=1 Tax=Salix viminalis TaxID=40686 RepID=A0A9Q0U7R3_SALVM|nr:hypothetical protein OIU85_022845 [Salix viminalis]